MRLISFSYSMSAAKSSAFSDATCEYGLENYDGRSEGMQKMRRITDEFDLISQFFCGFEDRNSQSDDCTSCADDLHR